MLGAIISLTTFVTVTAMVLAQQQASSSVSNCRIMGKSSPLRGLPEASGVAASRRTPGLFWAHNDSGEPVIFGIDSEGAIKSRVRVTGASVDDWEDIAVGPCPQGSCVYIADIGDNGGSRKTITVYRVVEPAPGDAATSRVEAFQAVYPDRPHDAEALFVSRDSDVFLITKGNPGSVALFRFPRPLASGTPLQLQQIGAPLAGPRIESKDRPTGADMSPDGQWVVVRTTHWLAFYRAMDLLAGRWREVLRSDVSSLGERQGEGVTFANNDTLVLVGEAGGLRGEGTFARLRCSLGR